MERSLALQRNRLQDKATGQGATGVTSPRTLPNTRQQHSPTAQHATVLLHPSPPLLTSPLALPADLTALNPASFIALPLPITWHMHAGVDEVRAVK